MKTCIDCRHIEDVGGAKSTDYQCKLDRVYRTRRGDFPKYVDQYKFICRKFKEKSFFLIHL